MAKKTFKILPWQSFSLNRCTLAAYFATKFGKQDQGKLLASISQKHFSVFSFFFPLVLVYENKFIQKI